MLLSRASAESVLLALNCVLLEMQVAVVASSIGSLTACTAALLSLILVLLVNLVILL